MNGGLILAAAKAHRWGLSLGACAALALLGVFYGQAMVVFPGIGVTVPVRHFTVVAAAVLVQAPLASAFPQLEVTLVRERAVRVVRVLATQLAALVVLTAVIPQAGGSAEAHGMLHMLLWLLAVGVAGAVTLGELSWAPPFTLGLGAIVFSGARYGVVVPPQLMHSPWWPALGVYILVDVLYIIRGPRRTALL